MRRRIVHGLGAALLFALIWSRQSYEPLSYYSSASYVDRANGLIRRKVLQYECWDQKIHLTSRATPAERKWFEASYLKTDVDLYNQNRELFGHFFVVEDCNLIEINPFLRTIRLPFAPSLEWLGDIVYSGPGADATLMSSNGRAILINHAVPSVSYREVRTPVASNEPVAANAVHFDFAGGFQTPAVEIHSVAGHAIIEQRIRRGQSGEARVLGHALPEGRIAQLQTGDWLYLSAPLPAERSETFLFTAERAFERLSTVRVRNATRERTYTEAEPLLRWVGGENGEEMLTFGQALAGSVSNALRQFDERRARDLANAFDVQLSIDRSLQASLDAALREEATDLIENTAGGSVFAASMTVMNGKNGEILTAASFPGASDVEGNDTLSDDERRRLLVNHNFRRHSIGSAGKPFIYAAIAAKHPYLLDLVIAPHAPEPRQDEGEGERETFQFFYPRDYKLWNHSDRAMDFESALERSCNKYTIELATLALAAPPDRNTRALNESLDRIFQPQRDVAWPLPGQSSGVSIAGQELTFPPSLGIYMKDDWKPVPPGEQTNAVLQPGSLDRMDEVPFIDTLAEITGVWTYGGMAPDVTPESSQLLGRAALQTMHYDLRVWRPLVERIAAQEDIRAAWKARAALQGVSPERVNLTLNHVVDFRNDFISVLLGGSSSQWTNVQLAEALSRLVTKRQVEATLVHSLPARNGQTSQTAARELAPLAITDESREAVLRGMRRTITGPQGTARVLVDHVSELQRRYPDYNVEVFSKTGSPTVFRSETKPAAAALERLFTRGRLFVRNGHICTSADGRSITPHAPYGSAGREAFVEALKAAARSVRQPMSRRTTARILGWVDLFERRRQQMTFASTEAVRLTENFSLPFYALAGQLVLNRSHPIFDPRIDSDSSAVYILSIVKWRGNGVNPDVLPSPEDLRRDDSRVITVVLYFDVGPGSAVAVEAARRLLPRLQHLLD